MKNELIKKTDKAIPYSIIVVDRWRYNESKIIQIDFFNDESLKEFINTITEYPRRPVFKMTNENDDEWAFGSYGRAVVAVYVFIADGIMFRYFVIDKCLVDKELPKK